jgi:hypothetical protein
MRGHIYIALLFIVLSANAPVAAEGPPTISSVPELPSTTTGQVVTVQGDCQQGAKDDMTNRLEANSEKKEMETELKKQSEVYTYYGRRDYFFAYTLVAVTLASSSVAGVAAITSMLPPLAVGILALGPTLSYLTAAVYKPQARANWHYRKADRLDALRLQLAHEDCSPKIISAEWRTLNAEMTKEWEDKFGLEPSNVPTPRGNN